jgi:hypothetical protein
VANLKIYREYLPIAPIAYKILLGSVDLDSLNPDMDPGILLSPDPDPGFAESGPSSIENIWIRQGF